MSQRATNRRFVNLKKQLDLLGVPLEGRRIRLKASKFRKEFKAGMDMVSGIHVDWTNDIRE